MRRALYFKGDNIAIGIATSVNDLVRQLRDATELPVEVVHTDPRPGEM